MNSEKRQGPNFFMRMILGAIALAFCNQLLKSAGINAHAGLNPVNLLTVGSLGVSGFGLLYAIILVHFL